jgi:hypothetical protein
MSEYDRLIDRGVADLAGVILRPGSEKEGYLWRTVSQALQLRSGRADGQTYRQDMIDVMFDIVLALRGAMKARLLERVPAKLGVTPEQLARVLDLEAQIMTRKEIELLVDAHLASGSRSE